MQSGVLLNSSISVEEVLTNDSITVVNVVWNVITPIGDVVVEDDESINRIKKNLDKVTQQIFIVISQEMEM